jgi:RNA polymerase sigma-70 factor (ECF subfamily)
LGSSLDEGTAHKFTALPPILLRWCGWWNGSAEIAFMETPASLLERLRQPREVEAWTRFVQLYTPLLYDWSRRLGLQASDAEDLVQDVFTVLVRRLPEFHYDRGKSFRGWLRTVLLNRWRDRSPKRAMPATVVQSDFLANVPAPEADLDFAEREYRTYLVDRTLQLLQAEFPELSWKAFTQYVLARRPATEVASELQVSVNIVYLAKSRVLSRLRQELTGLLD